MRHIDIAERRQRLASRHHLAVEARHDRLPELVGDVVGLHATDPASVYVEAMVRMERPAVDAVQQALYEDRSLIRMVGMRRTMFVVPVELGPVLQAACNEKVYAGEHRRAVRMLEEGGVTGDGETWLRDAVSATMAELEARGGATGAELSEAVPALRSRISVGEGTKWAQEVAMTTRVLFLLATAGRIVRGRPGGSWVSSQYRWHTVESWVPGGLPEVGVEEAQADLARRWLAAFGPATRTDLKWWAKWTLREVDRALHAVGAVEVHLDDATGFVLPDDVDPPPDPGPWVAFLPALDATPMGWQARDWFLGDHRRALFDRNGNIGPTVWCDGRIVGGWAHGDDGTVAWRLLEDVGVGNEEAIGRRAAALEELIGDVRIIPRFRTPLERELTT